MYIDTCWQPVLNPAFFRKAYRVAAGMFQDSLIFAQGGKFRIDADDRGKRRGGFRGAPPDRLALKQSLPADGAPPIPVAAASRDESISPACCFHR